jgi:hypothetical protein
MAVRIGVLTLATMYTLGIDGPLSDHARTPAAILRLKPPARAVARERRTVLNPVVG